MEYYTKEELDDLIEKVSKELDKIVSDIQAEDVEANHTISDDQISF